MIELTTSDMAHGGEAVARKDGKAHFVAGALPGERIVGEVTTDKGSWARVSLRDVLDPAPDRIEPRCPHFAACGGCQWQFASYEAQLEWKRSILAGQLAHIGKLPDVEVRRTLAPGEPFAYRNRMDFRVANGKPALHRYRSRELEPLDECHLLRPELQSLLGRLGPLHGVRKLTLRSSVHTGDTLAVVEGDLPHAAKEWGASVARRSSRGLQGIFGKAQLVERVAGVDFRITGGSFFQNNTAGAELLVREVAKALQPQSYEVLLDGFAGGGLFAATVGAQCEEVIAVEASPTAISDLRHNLEQADIAGVVYRMDFSEIGDEVDESYDVAVVDPPRVGLGTDGVEALVTGRPRAIAYVSCDPASLARDARLLTNVGYRLDWVRPVDMFPQTFHIEAVASFVDGA